MGKNWKGRLRQMGMSGRQARKCIRGGRQRKLKI
jgi:hypothetical protein